MAGIYESDLPMGGSLSHAEMVGRLEVQDLLDAHHAERHGSPPPEAGRIAMGEAATLTGDELRARDDEIAAHEADYSETNG